MVEQTCPSDDTHINQRATEGELEEEPPSILDIEIAIQSMSNNKSPGTDNISAELYKNGGKQLIKKVHTLIKGIWTEEKVPIDWKTNIIVPIYKNKGDNYSVQTAEKYCYYVQVIKY